MTKKLRHSTKMEATGYIVVTKSLIEYFFAKAVLGR